MTLAAVITELERRAAVAEREGATAPVANVYRLVLEELRDLGVDGNGDGGPADVRPDRLLTAAEAATQLGVAPKWLYRHAARLPFTRRLSPKVLRFSASGLARWLERRR